METSGLRVLEGAWACQLTVHLDVDVQWVGAVPVRETLMVSNPLQIRRLSVWPDEEMGEIPHVIEHCLITFQTMRFFCSHPSEGSPRTVVPYRHHGLNRDGWPPVEISAVVHDGGRYGPCRLDHCRWFSRWSAITVMLRSAAGSLPRIRSYCGSGAIIR